MSAKSLAQCLEWAHTQLDPEGDIADAVIRLRRYEQASSFAYGDPVHESLMTGHTDLKDAGVWNQTWSSTWIASGADPADILGELHWVETLYERMARLTYGRPAHLNAMRYAEAHRNALFDKLGLTPMTRADRK